VRREVEIGLSKGDRVEVVEGLAFGEDVIVSGQYNLEEGESVHVVAKALSVE
jgi:multidrug efflux pump subunit AcrA (membrane-fusion protein)